MESRKQNSEQTEEGYEELKQIDTSELDYSFLPAITIDHANHRRCLWCQVRVDVVGVCVLWALSVTFYAQAHRDEVAGQVLFVRKAKSLHRSEWITWVKTIFLSLSMFLAVSKLTGPITSFVIVILGTLFRKTIDEYIYSIDANAKDAWRELKSYAGYASLCFNLLRLAWSREWYHVVIVLLLEALAFMWFNAKILNFFTVPEQFHYISPTFPIVVSFQSQNQVPELLSIRRKLKEIPEFNESLGKIAVGSYWAETVLSVLVYHDVYNSMTVRKYTHLFVAYALPLIFAFQMLYTIWPMLTHHRLRFVKSVRTDYGVIVLKKGLDSLLSVFGYYPIIPQVVLDATDAIVGVVSSATAWFAYVSAFLVPLDEALVYIRAKFEPIRLLLVGFVRLLSPLISLLTKFGQVAHGAVVPVVKITMFFMSRIVEPTRKIVSVTTVKPVFEVRTLYHKSLVLLNLRPNSPRPLLSNSSSRSSSAAPSRVGSSLATPEKGVASLAAQRPQSMSNLRTVSNGGNQAHLSPSMPAITKYADRAFQDIRDNVGTRSCDGLQFTPKKRDNNARLSEVDRLIKTLPSLV